MPDKTNTYEIQNNAIVWFRNIEVGNHVFFVEGGEPRTAQVLKIESENEKVGNPFFIFITLNWSKDQYSNNIKLRFDEVFDNEADAYFKAALLIEDEINALKKRKARFENNAIDAQKRKEKID